MTRRNANPWFTRILQVMLVSTALGLAALPARAAQADSASQVLAAVETLETRDRAAALTLLDTLLQRPGLGADERLQALVKRCWTAAPLQADSVLQQWPMALAEAERLRAVGAIAELQLCRGYLHELQQKPVEARQAYEQAVADAERMRLPTLLASALALRGESRHQQGLFALALADLHRAHQLALAQQRRSLELQTLNDIANLYADAEVGDFARAIEYFQRLIQAHEKAGELENLASIVFNLASTLERQQNYAAALQQFRRAEQLELQLKRPLEAAYAQRSIGIVLGKLGQAGEALPVLDTALARFLAGGDEDRAMQTRLSRAVVLRLLGRPREALPELALALPFFRQDGAQRFVEKALDEQAQDLALLGQWQAAALAREAQLKVLRQLTEQSKATQTSRLRVQFDSEQKEAQNRALQAENEKRAAQLARAAAEQRLQGIALLATLVALVALAALGWHQYRHARRMRELALTDELTRLPNRRHLWLRAEAQIRQAQADGQPLSLLALDIDHFKRINDRFGHDAGDLVLRRVADALQHALRRNDVLGRTGGEEFVALLPGAALPLAQEVAERLRQAVEAVPLDEIDAGLRCSISLGLDQLRPGERALEPLLKRADAALYQAKAQGRNRVQLASND